jgi:hypothetical protein
MICAQKCGSITSMCVSLSACICGNIHSMSTHPNGFESMICAQKRACMTEPAYAPLSPHVCVCIQGVCILVCQGVCILIFELSTEQRIPSGQTRIEQSKHGEQAKRTNWSNLNSRGGAVYSAENKKSGSALATYVGYACPDPYVTANFRAARLT